MQEFTHSDRRIFRHIGAAHHLTRDGRDVTLQVWETTCLHPGCQERLAVKTVSFEPYTFAKWAPAKYCKEHRQEARKAAAKNLAAKRREGYQKWAESEGGKAKLRDRKENYIGPIERLIYEEVQAYALADLPAPWPAVFEEVLSKAPQRKLPDRRSRTITNAATRLIQKGRLRQVKDELFLVR